MSAAIGLACGTLPTLAAVILSYARRPDRSLPSPLSLIAHSLVGAAVGVGLAALLGLVILA